METESLPRERNRREIHRVLISQPMGATPYPEHSVPSPVLLNGARVQVTAHTSEFGEIVERWQFSDTDVRWYRLEAFRDRWVTLKIPKRTSLDR